MSSLGQLLMSGVPGPELDSATAATFRRVQPGAFILFGRNIQTPSQLRKLIDDLRAISDVEPIITIDQEGGRVSRLKLIGQRTLAFADGPLGAPSAVDAARAAGRGCRGTLRGGGGNRVAVGLA